MKRRDFGSWGIDLDDDRFACALAALGVLAGAQGAGQDSDAASLSRTLAGALGEAQTPVPCILWPLQFGWREEVLPRYSARSFAEAWIDAVRSGEHPRLGPRLELWPASGKDAVWLAEQLSRDAVRTRSVYVRHDFPEADVGWSWPLRVGFLRDPRSERLRWELQRDLWLHDHVEFIDAVAPGAEPDLLLLPLGLRDALSAALSAPAQLKADAVVVLGGLDTGAEIRATRIVSLRAEVKTGGVALADVAEGKRKAWFEELIRKLSHDFPLDVALFGAARNTDAPPPLLFASRRLIDVAQVSRHAAALGDRLRRVEEPHEIRLPPKAAGRMGLAGVSTPVREVGERLMNVLPNLEFGHEYEDASTVAEISRAARELLRAMPGQAKVTRRIESRVHDMSDPDEPRLLERAMRVGAPHRIDVRIGVGEEGWQQLATPFPDERMPLDPAGSRLTVVFTELNLSPTPQVASIHLPREGASSVAAFFVHARDGVDRMEARVIVLHENRVLQTARIEARIVAEPSRVPADDRIALVPETFVSLSLEDLGGRRPFDAALVLNHVGETPVATTVAGDFAVMVRLNNVDVFVDNIAAKLSQVASGDAAYDDLDSEEVRKLMYFLASQGSMLFEEICADRQAREVLRKASRVQVSAAKPGSLLPVEMAYDRRAPVPEATVCPHARKALQDGCCQTGCPAGDDAEEVICPLGFWGLSRVIERQSDGTLPMGADFGLRVNGGGGKRLRILDGAILAASERVDAEVPGSTARVERALRDAVGEQLVKAEGWTEWVEGIKQKRPSLLTLLVHVDKDRGADLQALSIGDDDLLSIARIYEQHVRGEAGDTPVVLLVGCKTSLADIEFQKFPVRFQRQGAALVVGTIATVLGRHAGPVTAALVDTLKEIVAQGEPCFFGDVLLAAKQRLVAEGRLMAMCLCVHGDAGWILYS